MNPNLDDLSEGWYDEELLKGLGPESILKQVQHMVQGDKR